MKATHYLITRPKNSTRLRRLVVRSYAFAVLLASWFQMSSSGRRKKIIARQGKEIADSATLVFNEDNRLQAVTVVSFKLIMCP